MVIQIGIVTAIAADELIRVGVAAFRPAADDPGRLAPENHRPVLPRLTMGYHACPFSMTSLNFRSWAPAGRFLMPFVPKPWCLCPWGRTRLQVRPAGPCPARGPGALVRRGRGRAQRHRPDVLPQRLPILVPDDYRRGRGRAIWAMHLRQPPEPGRPASHGQGGQVLRGLRSGAPEGPWTEARNRGAQPLHRATMNTRTAPASERDQSELRALDLAEYVPRPATTFSQRPYLRTSAAY